MSVSHTPLELLISVFKLFKIACLEIMYSYRRLSGSAGQLDGRPCSPTALSLEPSISGLCNENHF